MSKDKTAPERVARDKAKKLKAGLVRVNVWVPAKRRAELLAIAGVMRDG
jgi:hypothetical protein